MKEREKKKQEIEERKKEDGVVIAHVNTACIHVQYIHGLQHMTLKVCKGKVGEVDVHTRHTHVTHMTWHMTCNMHVTGIWHICYMAYIHVM